MELLGVQVRAGGCAAEEEEDEWLSKMGRQVRYCRRLHLLHEKVLADGR